MDKPPESCNDAASPNDFQEKGRITFQCGRLHVTGTWDSPSDEVIREVGRILREKVDRMCPQRSPQQTSDTTGGETK